MKKNKNTDQNEEEISRPIARRSGIVMTIIEFIGSHPFATGLLAILGVVGFIISVVSFRLDLIAAEQGEADTAVIQGNLETVVSQVTANCKLPPCWTLADFVANDPISKPKELIENKLSSPIEKRGSEYIYDFDGCQLRVEYRDDAVSYFMVSLTKRAPAVAVSIPCDFDVNDVAILSYPQIVRGRDHLQIGDILPTLHQMPITISQACLDCGNYAEPYAEFVVHGPRASGSRIFHFRTDSDTASIDEEQAYYVWNNFVNSLKERSGQEFDASAELHPVCGLDITESLQTFLLGGRVKEIGISDEPRSKDHALYCP